MKRILKSKMLLGVGCLLLAAVIAFCVLPGVYDSKTDTTHAVKVAADIPAGTVIEDNMVISSEVSAYGLPSSVVLEKEDAVGKVACETLYAGEYLTDTHIITEEEYQTLLDEENKGLGSGYCLVAVQFPAASAGVASGLRSGHIVDVHECIEDEEDNVTVQKVLSSMYVYDVLNASLQSLSELDVKLAEALEEDDTDYDFETAIVVIRCTEEQAQTLIRLERMESLHLTLQRTGG